MPIIKHCVGLDVRVRGSGGLRSKLISLDDAREQILVPLTMAALPGKTNTRLANFSEEKMYLEIWTEEIDEVFEINEITPFLKVRAISYPG